VATLGCGGAGTTGLSGPSPEQVQSSTVALQQPDAARLVSANNEFGLRLLSRLTEAGGNVFISPVSISTAVSMAYNGAAGETRAEIARVFGWQGLDLAQLNTANQDLLRVLQHADPKVVSWVANSVWAKEGYPIEPSFLQRCRDSYDAEVKTIDFASPGAPKEINAWVSQKTNEKIKDIIDKIPPEAILYLINATYFNGKWKEPFKKEATQNGVFHAAGGDAQVPMMSQRGRFQHAKGSGFSALALPYGDGTRMSMFIVLPDAGKDWRTVAKPAMEARLTVGECALQIPKFRTEYKTSLKDTLSAMGMPAAFDPAKADLSGISRADQLFIMEVIHKSYVDVNEEGTEAAAVTEIGVGATSEPLRPFEFIVDRPFVFFIRDEVTKAVLFAGLITSPTS
jgi:serpin B